MGVLKFGELCYFSTNIYVLKFKQRDDILVNKETYTAASRILWAKKVSIMICKCLLSWGV